MSLRAGQDWWLKNFGDVNSECFQEWFCCVSDLKPEQIAAGVFRSRDDTGYPTAQKFRQHCIGPKDEGGLTHNTGAYREYVPKSHRLVDQTKQERDKAAVSPGLVAARAALFKNKGE